MQLSTKARYATRAMMELAAHYGKGPIQLKEIARRQDLSEKYLEQVMFPLRTNGFIYTQKGNKGGYLLSLPPDTITLANIVQTVEGSVAPVACVDNPEVCQKTQICAARDVWFRLKGKVLDELEGTSLADLVVAQERKIQQDAEAK